MPELPEVEVIKEGLKEKLKGRIIKRVDILFPKSIKGISSLSFKERIAGRRFKKISRRAKFLIFSLDDDSFMVIHLKMAGQLIYCSGKTLVDKHTGLIFILDNGAHLRFLDLRRFGVIYLVKDLKEVPLLPRLGPEPLTDSFNASALKKILEGQKRKIKIVLTDQEVLAGLGNIYAVEVLYEAGIHPERRANRLSEAEIRKLPGIIKRVLKRAIRARGTSTDNYRDAEGKKGNFQAELQVYQRDGKPCSRCGAKISRIKLSGRGTFFCPGCQK